MRVAGLGSNHERHLVVLFDGESAESVACGAFGEGPQGIRGNLSHGLVCTRRHRSRQGGDGVG